MGILEVISTFFIWERERKKRRYIIITYIWSGCWLKRAEPGLVVTSQRQMHKIVQTRLVVPAPVVAVSPSSVTAACAKAHSHIVILRGPMIPGHQECCPLAGDGIIRLKPVVPALQRVYIYICVYTVLCSQSIKKQTNKKKEQTHKQMNKWHFPPTGLDIMRRSWRAHNDFSVIMSSPTLMQRFFFLFFFLSPFTPLLLPPPSHTLHTLFLLLLLFLRGGDD